MALLVSCSTTSLTEGKIDSLLASAESLPLSEAVTYYSKLYTTYPFEEKIGYNYALLLAESGQIDDSLEILQAMDEYFDHRHIRVLKAIGSLAVESEKNELAVASWHTLLEVDPLDDTSRQLLIDYYTEKELYEQAYELAYEKVELQQYSASSLKTLASLEQLSEKGDGKKWLLLADSLN